MGEGEYENGVYIPGSLELADLRDSGRLLSRPLEPDDDERLRSGWPCRCGDGGHEDREHPGFCMCGGKL